jgi:putative NIF3 family GTP cyclohydrolase 1 type 2
MQRAKMMKAISSVILADHHVTERVGLKANMKARDIISLAFN